MTQLPSALCGYPITETIKGKVAIVKNAPIVPREERATLNALVTELNGGLQRLGMLGRWRAKIGGTSTELWVLLIGGR